MTSHSLSAQRADFRGAISKIQVQPGQFSQASLLQRTGFRKFNPTINLYPNPNFFILYIFMLLLQQTA
jgi:hypothetical protein